METYQAAGECAVGGTLLSQKWDKWSGQGVPTRSLSTLKRALRLAVFGQDQARRAALAVFAVFQGEDASMRLGDLA